MNLNKLRSYKVRIGLVVIRYQFYLYHELCKDIAIKHQTLFLAHMTRVIAIIWRPSQSSMVQIELITYYY
jgi:hypothetical protein